MTVFFVSAAPFGMAESRLRHGRVLERQSAAACLASMARSKAWPGRP